MKADGKQEGGYHLILEHFYGIAFLLRYLCYRCIALFIMIESNVTDVRQKLLYDCAELELILTP